MTLSHMKCNKARLFSVPLIDGLEVWVRYVLDSYVLCKGFIVTACKLVNIVIVIEFISLFSGSSQGISWIFSFICFSAKDLL
jgi:hypothetical protein